MSIGYGFRGSFIIRDARIEGLNIRSSALDLMRTDLTLDSVTFKDISRDIDSTARLLRIESNSEVQISNSIFQDINFSIVSVTDSVMRINDTYISNITASQYVIECYTSTGIIFQNLTIFDSQSDDKLGMTNFRDCVIESISNSNFIESQLLVLMFRNTLVKEFTHNTLDSMNRGIKIMSGSNATITNTVFKNMVQNIKESKLYYSEIKRKGSAIGMYLKQMNINLNFRYC